MEREPQSAYSRLKASGLLQALDGRVAEANLYRFCQLLEQALPNHPPLGSTTHPADDPVRFRPDPGMGFPAGEIRAIESDGNHPQRPATVRTRLLGLYGVDSPLPSAFVDDIAQRREGHEALEAFLDIFNHRIFTQFYRIWRKYSYPANFEEGGSDATSQCLLGLIGLGIPGTAERIATPVSRFLALLSVMRLPTRNAEGISALVTLLAPQTRVKVTPHWPQKIPLARPARLSAHHPVCLSQDTPLGAVGHDANSQLHLGLFTEDQQEARGWLPGGQLYNDLRVLLRVYLGWRCTAKLQLSATDSTASTARSIFYKQVKTLHLDLSSRVAMNTDESNMNGLAVPTLVRVYQLRNDKTWAKASYESLLGDDDNLLRSDLLDRRAVVVKPGEGTQLSVPMDKDAQFVTVVALFRQPDTERDTWRLTLSRDDLDPDRARVIELGDNRLTLRSLARE